MALRPYGYQEEALKLPNSRPHNAHTHRFRSHEQSYHLRHRLQLTAADQRTLAQHHKMIAGQNKRHAYLTPIAQT